ncbi:MAG: hypothetical protein K4305_08960 [Chlorobium sp.]|uniref:hypothetical protein n=1 Tax=Chlorobium sp. TaxID=1095 RepID=UPI002F403D01
MDDVTAGALYFRLLQAFPKMTDGVSRIILERLADNGFTCCRAIDAVNHVIDTYEGWDKCPNVANFVGFNRRVKTLSYAELNHKHDKGEIAWSDYEPIDVGLEMPRWAKREDVQQYNLTRWVVKQQQQGRRG